LASVYQQNSSVAIAIKKRSLLWDENNKEYIDAIALVG
jgi:acetylornithine/succinyldiaminopimelate/putrescine aminotransferase